MTNSPLFESRLIPSISNSVGIYGDNSLVYIGSLISFILLNSQFYICSLNRFDFDLLSDLGVILDERICIEV